MTAPGPKVTAANDFARNEFEPNGFQRSQSRADEFQADESQPDGHRLADVLSEFARTMLTDFPIQAVLDRLVKQIVNVLPISSAGVTLISPGTAPRYIAASDEAALCYERVQTELDEGPCVLAHSGGEAVSVPDLTMDTRFPRFGPRAVAAGLGAVFAFPLIHGKLRLGALDLYCERPGRLTPEEVAIARTLADVVTASLLNAQARTDLQAARDRCREAALHDPLTGLPNRTLMIERLEHAFLRSRRSGKSTAVVFVDLDRFKAVNEVYGHRIGDELLVAVARRLARFLRPADTLARLSGDEFVAICEDLDSSDQAASIAGRLDAALLPRFSLSGVQIAVTASIGIAFADEPAQVGYTPEQLIHEADLAIYQAKQEGGHRRIFQPHILRLSGLERDLTSAESRGELELQYQPIFAVADRRITGFEGFVRWRHPHRGWISPEIFVPLAEKSGLINNIGRWALEQAWADRHRWQAQFDADLQMSVNVSSFQLMSVGFAATVAAVLDTIPDAPSLLTLEMTENSLVQDSERAVIVLSDLKQLGVTLAIDNFGSGYSSLIHLRKFPVDVIKMNSSFIATLDRDPTSRAIPGAVVDIAHQLGMKVVADGVETADQHDQVARIGCDYSQGIFFAEPAPPDQIDALISSRADDHRWSA